MADRDEIDWETLAGQLDALGVVDSWKAKQALAELIGEARVRSSVEWYISGRPGAELARHVLWQLQPTAARDRCVEIWRTDADPTRRRVAVELLRVVATADDLDLVEELLADGDDGVQNWGVGVLDQLLWSHQVDPADAQSQLALARTHANADVRRQAASIDEYLGARDESAGSVLILGGSLTPSLRGLAQRANR